MVKDECGLVHLTQDQQHLVVYELLVLLEVAAHMLLQFVTDLMTRMKHRKKRFTKRPSQSFSNITFALN